MDQEGEAVGAVAAARSLAAAGLTAEELAAVRRRMLAVVSRACPRWLADQAEDIVQTALVRVMRAQERSGEKPEAPASYLMRAAHTATIDEIRRQFRRPEISEGKSSMVERSPSPLPHPEREAAAREIDRGIRDCLIGLARPRRRAVTLYLLGHSLKETGRLLGWSPKRAEHLIYRGLADLRSCLSAKGLKP
jgi:RNA polymerase sigma-70 factor (ECF subfamily)